MVVSPILSHLVNRQAFTDTFHLVPIPPPQRTRHGPQLRQRRLVLARSPMGMVEETRSLCFASLYLYFPIVDASEFQNYNSIIIGNARDRSKADSEQQQKVSKARERNDSVWYERRTKQQSIWKKETGTKTTSRTLQNQPSQPEGDLPSHLRVPDYSHFSSH